MPKFIDLTALSLSGSLVPSVPTQLLLRYEPPKLTITYHFEDNAEERYFHDIHIDRELLFSMTVEDFVSHLYVTEAYYFNPKQVKRPQLLRMIGILRQNTIPPKHQEKETRYFERKRRENRAEPNSEEDEPLYLPEVKQKRPISDPLFLN